MAGVLVFADQKMEHTTGIYEMLWAKKQPAFGAKLSVIGKGV